MRIDHTDLEIVRALQADGRASLREIAKRLGVVEGTVRARLKKLQEDGVLRIVAFADPAKLGKGAMSLVFLDVEPDRHESVIAALQEWDEVSYLSETLGETGICAQVVCRDPEDLGVMRQKISSLPGVRGIRLLPEAKVYKMHFSLNV